MLAARIAALLLVGDRQDCVLVENLQPAVLDGLRRRGARYFATTVMSRIEKERPHAAEYLRYQYRVPIANAPGDTAVFELGRRAE